MTARSVIEHALTVYYADARDPQGLVAKLLDMYDAERDATQRAEGHGEGWLNDRTPDA